MQSDALRGVLLPAGRERRGLMAERNTTPTPGEITIMAAGAVALVFSFLKFYKAPVGPGHVSAWGSGLFPVATLMVIFVVIMAVSA